MTRVPADEPEHAFGVDAMRAALATIVHGRKRPVVLTERSRRKAYGVMLRMVVDGAGTITLWTEPAPDDDTRHGVLYVTDPPAEPPR